MNIFKRSVINITRQPVKSIILCLLIFILGTALSGAISVRNAIITTEESLMLRIAPVSTIGFIGTEHAATMQPTREEISAVGNLPYVRTYDFTLRVNFMSQNLLMPDVDIDLDKIPSEHHGMIQWLVQSPRVRGGSMDEFHGRGVHNPEITDIATGLITLIDGRTFTQEEIDENAKVVVVSRELAEVNNLSTGSMIELENIAHDYRFMGRDGTGDFAVDRSNEDFMVARQTLEFQVIGIFDINHEFVYEGTDHDLHPAIIQRIDLYSRFYMPSGVAAQMLNFVIDAMDDEMLEVAMPNSDDMFESIFVLYHPRDLETFSTYAKELLPESWGMRDSSGAFTPIIASMDTMLQIADGVQWVIAFASMVILTLVIALFLRDRRHEIGTYMALGDKKARVIIQILIEIGLIATVATTLALFAGNILSDTISRSMFEQQLTQQMQESNHVVDVIPWELALFNPGEISIEETLEMYNIMLDVTTVFTFIGVGSAVILVSTIIPIWYVVKLEPKEILM